MSSMNSTLDSGIAHFNKLKDNNIIINGLYGLAGLHFRTIKFFVAKPITFVYGILTENSDILNESETTEKTITTLNQTTNFIEAVETLIKRIDKNLRVHLENISSLKTIASSVFNIIFEILNFFWNFIKSIASKIHEIVSKIPAVRTILKLIINLARKIGNLIIWAISVIASLLSFLEIFQSIIMLGLSLIRFLLNIVKKMFGLVSLISSYLNSWRMLIV